MVDNHVLEVVIVDQELHELFNCASMLELEQGRNIFLTNISFACGISQLCHRSLSISFSATTTGNTARTGWLSGLFAVCSPNVELQARSNKHWDGFALQFQCKCRTDSLQTYHPFAAWIDATGSSKSVIEASPGNVQRQVNFSLQEIVVLLFYCCTQWSCCILLLSSLTIWQ